jgi:hypothetical protein
MFFRVENEVHVAVSLWILANSFANAVYKKQVHCWYLCAVCTSHHASYYVERREQVLYELDQVLACITQACIRHLLKSEEFPFRWSVTCSFLQMHIRFGH